MITISIYKSKKNFSDIGISPSRETGRPKTQWKDVTRKEEARRFRLGKNDVHAIQKWRNRVKNGSKTLVMIIIITGSSG